MIQQILSQAASIFLLIGLGLLAARTKIFPEDGTDVLCRLQLNVVTPIMILVTMQGHTFAGQLAMDTLWSFLSYGLTVAAVGLLSFPLVRLLRLGEEDQGVCRIQLAFKNIGFMGIPLVSAVLGQRPGVVIVLMNTLFGVLLYSLGMVLLLYRRGCRVFSRDFLRRVVNLPLVSSLLGILVLVTGFTLPETVNRGLTLVSDMMVPLGMFIVGLQLSRTDLRRIVSPRNLAFCALSLLLVPLLALGIGSLLPESAAVTATLVFAMAMPSGTLCAILTEETGRNTDLASGTLALSTLFSLGTLPVWALFLLSHFSL